MEEKLNMARALIVRCLGPDADPTDWSRTLAGALLMAAEDIRPGDQGDLYVLADGSGIRLGPRGCHILDIVDDAGDGDTEVG